MARINLSQMDMGLQNRPKSDPLHDTQTLLNRSLGSDSDDYRSIPLSQIRVNPSNDYSKEDTEEEIRELALDIERNGLLHNIVVSSHPDEEKYMILSGERRFRAYTWLYENRHENRYSVILCKVLSGLSPIDEMLVLDAANLQTRGGLSDEKRYRKATVRFLDNLRTKGGISEEEAKSLAVRYTGISETLLDKNISVETDLHPAIRSLLDADLISKNQAVAYARLPENVQETIAENLTAAHESGLAELRDVNERLGQATKTIAELQAKIETQEKKALAVDRDIEQAQISLTALNAMTEEGENPEELSGQISVLRQSLSDLEMQKRLYSSTISSARAALKKSEDKLSGIKPEEQKHTGNQDSAVLVNKAVKKAETAVGSVVSRTNVSRLQRMDAQGKNVMLERLRELRQSLDTVIEQLEQGKQK